jgi:predicted DNA-binding transcriptional regulator YafY
LRESDQAVSLKSSALNSTAYRIFKILEWLQLQPLSVDEINQRFLEDPMVGKRLSTDTLWLYLNTLRQLGCEISRPMPSNHYRHELHSHPFGLHLTPEEVGTLGRLKAIAENDLNYQEILTWDSFLKKLLNRATCVEKDAWLQRLFDESRSIDYGADQEKIQLIQEACQKSQLLYITYESPNREAGAFYFLPETLSYRRGSLYLQGLRELNTELSSLRIDRIVQLRIALDQPALLQTLLSRQTQPPLVHLRLFGVTAETWQPLTSEQETVSFSQLEDGMPFADVQLKSRDFFSLRQRLLSCGYPFDILAPPDLKEQMVELLGAIQLMYCEKGDPRPPL